MMDVMPALQGSVSRKLAGGERGSRKERTTYKTPMLIAIARPSFSRVPICSFQTVRAPMKARPKSAAADQAPANELKEMTLSKSQQVPGTVISQFLVTGEHLTYKRMLAMLMKT